MAFMACPLKPYNIPYTTLYCLGVGGKQLSYCHSDESDPCAEQDYLASFFFFPVPVYAITASGVPGGTLVSMNRFSTLCV
jgi:hypothetical protein